MDHRYIWLYLSSSLVFVGMLLGPVGCGSSDSSSSFPPSLSSPPTPIPTLPSIPTPAGSPPPSPIASPSPSLAPDSSPSPAPSASPAPSPSPEPSLSPLPTPGSSPSPNPSPSPDLTPTPGSSPSPNPSPSPSPTITASPQTTNIVTLESALPTPTFAGDLQIEVQAANFAVAQIEILGSNGNAVFERQDSGSPGSTAYLPGLDSALVNLSGVQEFTVNGINTTCLVINQIAGPDQVLRRSTACF